MNIEKDLDRLEIHLGFKPEPKIGFLKRLFKRSKKKDTWG